MGKVLIACEYSGRVREAFAKLGHEAWSCDLLPTEIPSERHYQGDVFDIIYKEWDLIIAHPPCTYLCNSGVRWLKSDPKRWIDLRYAADFFKLFFHYPDKYVKIAIENPVMHGHAVKIIGQNFTQSFQPWHFGHEEVKRTCLWLRGLPPLKYTNVVGPPPKDPEIKKLWAKVHRASPGPDRWKERSRTFTGVAEAMAEQWGPLI